MRDVAVPLVRIDEAQGHVARPGEPGRPDLWRYVYGARRRPFVHPLTTPAGIVLTRNAPDDHPWHHGLWFTIKFVNGENFWEEYGDYGVVRHDRVPRVVVSEAGVVVSGRLSWTRPDRTTVVMRETRSLTHVPIDGESYAIDFDTTLHPVTDVQLDRTPFTTWGGYGGLAFRGAPNLHDTRILLSDGSVFDTEQVLGVPADWLDLSGLVSSGAGEVSAGVTIHAAPGHPRCPVPWYGSTRSSTYGEGWSNFVNAAFLWDGPVKLAAGEALAFRYRVVVHDGVRDQDRASADHDDYLAALTSRDGPTD